MYAKDFETANDFYKDLKDYVAKALFWSTIINDFDINVYQCGWCCGFCAASTWLDCVGAWGSVGSFALRLKAFLRTERHPRLT